MAWHELRWPRCDSVACSRIPHSDMPRSRACAPKLRRPPRRGASRDAGGEHHSWGAPRRWPFPPGRPPSSPASPPKRITAPIQCGTRCAVSRFPFQMGSSIPATSAGVIRSIGQPPSLLAENLFGATGQVTRAGETTPFVIDGCHGQEVTIMITAGLRSFGSLTEAA